ncbi:MAG TPA: phage tail protein [Spongiibacteraceae bacterium]|nr:phage tail protein [Spongiibacteraceae bacterium]HCS28290.1 phage tail protein [Spongiibacteraceae bacterium]
MKRPSCAAIILVLMSGALPPPSAQASANPLLGEIMWVGFNFCPRGWATAEGQLLAISSNTALFSLLGTTFGGDGRTTFGLPDLRGRSAVGYGNGPGLTPISWGQKSGNETVTLTTNQLPAHSHPLRVTTDDANRFPGQGRMLATPIDIDGQRNTGIYRATNTPPDATLDAASIGNTGGGQAAPIRNPYLGLRPCIATQGVFPSRN